MRWATTESNPMLRPHGDSIAFSGWTPQPLAPLPPVITEHVARWRPGTPRSEARYLHPARLRIEVGEGVRDPHLHAVASRSPHAPPSCIIKPPGSSRRECRDLVHLRDGTL